MTFGDAGQIVRVTASFVLGAVDENTLPIQQEFQITFVQVPFGWICECFIVRVTSQYIITYVINYTEHLRYRYWYTVFSIQHFLGVHK